MAASGKPIVVVGSINMDLVVNAVRIPVEGETVAGTGFQFHPGGKGANQAVAVARLGYPVSMIGRLGDDAFGAQLRRHLRDAGVDVAGVATSPGTSGVAVIIVGPFGENSIVISPGANALLLPDDVDASVDIIRSAGMVLTQLEIPMQTVEYLAWICSREGVPLILDPAPASRLSRELLGRLDWFTPNETEAAFYTEDAVSQSSDPTLVAQTLRSQGVRRLVLKLGARGAYLKSGAEPGEFLSSFPVGAVDTTAAGDAFNGAFATGLLMGKGPIGSARFATAAAALSVTRAGAQSSLPGIEEVEDLLARSGPQEKNAMPSEY